MWTVAFVLALLMGLVNSQINWNGNDWANSCDFWNHDFASAQVPDTQCGPTCAQTSGCTHYTWAWGTCWMKNGDVTKQDAFFTNNNQMVCGVVGSSNTGGGGGVNWNGNNWALSCDFKNDDFTSAGVASSECGPTCARTPGCTHYTWSTYNGGTCWMKNGAVTKQDAFLSSDSSLVCGVVDSVNDGGGGGGGSGSGGGVSVTQSQFNSAVTSCGFPSPSGEKYTAFIGGIAKSGITSVRELAMFVANILHESDGLRAMREYQCQTNGCVGMYLPPGPGGVVYYGRGYIQLTWADNYRAASKYLFGDENVLLNNPDRVATDQNVAWGTAFWYWYSSVHSAPGVTDGRFGASIKAINGAQECGSNNDPRPRVRYGYYVKVLRNFGVNEAPIENGCYN